MIGIPYTEAAVPGPRLDSERMRPNPTLRYVNSGAFKRPDAPQIPNKQRKEYE